MCQETNLWLLFIRLQNAREAVRFASEEAPGVPGLLENLARAEVNAARMLEESMMEAGEVECYSTLGGVRTELCRRWISEVQL